MTTGGVASPQGGAAPFPDDFPDGPDRSAEHWDLSRVLPLPTRPLRCPFCGGVLAMKDWKYHQRQQVGSASPWRCDVRMKCMGCGYVPTFGVLVPKEMFERAESVFAGKNGAWIHWRVGREAMEEAP